MINLKSNWNNEVPENAKHKNIFLCQFLYRLFALYLNACGLYTNPTKWNYVVDTIIFFVNVISTNPALNTCSKNTNASGFTLTAKLS